MSAIENLERRIERDQAELERLLQGDDGSEISLARELKRRYGFDMPARRDGESLTAWTQRGRREQEGR